MPLGVGPAGYDWSRDLSSLLTPEAQAEQRRRYLDEQAYLQGQDVQPHYAGGYAPPAYQNTSPSQAGLTGYGQRLEDYQAYQNARNDKINEANAERQTRANLLGSELQEHQRSGDARLWEEEQNRKEHARQFGVTQGEHAYEFDRTSAERQYQFDQEQKAAEQSRRDRVYEADATRRFTADRDVYDTQSRQAQQERQFQQQNYQTGLHAQTQAWLHEQELTQGEKARMQKLQNGVSHIEGLVGSGKLRREDADEAIAQIMTGLSPLQIRAKRDDERRKAETHELAWQQHSLQSELLAHQNAQAQVMAQHNARGWAENFEANAKLLPDGTRVYLDPTGKPHVIPPAKDPEAEHEFKRQEAELKRQDQLHTLRLKQEAHDLDQRQKEMDFYIKAYDQEFKNQTVKGKEGAADVTPEHKSITDTLEKKGLYNPMEVSKRQMPLDPGETMGRDADGQVKRFSRPGGPGPQTGAQKQVNQYVAPPASSPPATPPASAPPAAPASASPPDEPQSFIMDGQGRFRPATRFEPQRPPMDQSDTLRSMSPVRPTDGATSGVPPVRPPAPSPPPPVSKAMAYLSDVQTRARAKGDDRAVTAAKRLADLVSQYGSEGAMSDVERFWANKYRTQIREFEGRP